MADQDLQIRGGGGLKKILFWPSGPHFGLKLSGGGGGWWGGGGSPGPPLWLFYIDIKVF